MITNTNVQTQYKEITLYSQCLVNTPALGHPPTSMQTYFKSSQEIMCPPTHHGPYACVYCSGLKRHIITPPGIREVSHMKPVNRAMWGKHE